jgi:hypothetical protein
MLDPAATPGEIGFVSGGVGGCGGAGSPGGLGGRSGGRGGAAGWPWQQSAQAIGFIVPFFHRHSRDAIRATCSHDASTKLLQGKDPSSR